MSFLKKLKYKRFVGVFFHKKKAGAIWLPERLVNWTQILNIPVSMTLTLIVAKNPLS